MSSENNSDVYSGPRYRRINDKQNKQSQHYKSKDILETSGYSRPVTHKGVYQSSDSSVYDEIYDIHPSIHHSETDSEVTGNLHPLTPYSSIEDKQVQHSKSSDLRETFGYNRHDRRGYHGVYQSSDSSDNVYHALPRIHHSHSNKEGYDPVSWTRHYPVSWTRHSHGKVPLPDSEMVPLQKKDNWSKRKLSQYINYKSELSDSHAADDYVYHKYDNTVPYEYSENKTYSPSEEPDYANISDVSNLPPLPPPLPPRNKAISTPKSTTEEHVYVNIPNPILSYPSFTRPMKFFNFSDDDFIHYRSHSPLKNMHLKRQNWPDTPKELLLSKPYTKRQDTKGANSGTPKRIQGKYCAQLWVRHMFCGQDL